MFSSLNRMSEAPDSASDVSPDVSDTRDHHFMLFSVCVLPERLYLIITSHINKHTEPQLPG